MRRVRAAQRTGKRTTKRRAGPAKTVEAYIAAAAPEARPMLRQIRRTVRAAAPKAEERVSYGMPYYTYHGRLAYFAAFREHVSFFFMGSRELREKLARSVARYRTSKATLRFPLGTRVPVSLIAKLVKARAKENEARS